MTDKPFIALITPMSLPTDGGGGGGGEHPDHTLPGDLPHPEHPIYYPLPPGAPVDPEYGVPEGGPVDPGYGIDEGEGAPGGGEPPHPDHTLPGDLPHPEHPIVLPPDGEVTPPDNAPPIQVEWKAIWTPSNGWQTIGVVIPAEDTPVVTPSQGRQAQRPQQAQQSNRPSRQAAAQAPKPSGIPGRGAAKPQPPRPPSRRR